MIDNKISSLKLEMQNRVIPLLEEAKTVLPALIVFETKRTEQRQAQLYGLGRSWNQMVWAYPYSPNFWCYAKKGATKRTWTTDSKHLRGEAVDFAFKINGSTTWDVREEDWDKLIELGKKYGLKSLAPLEKNHLELDLSLTPFEMPEPFVIPEWAVPACRKAKEKGIITKNFDEPITAYRLCAILDNLKLLD